MISYGSVSTETIETVLLPEEPVQEQEPPSPQEKKFVDCQCVGYFFCCVGMQCLWLLFSILLFIVLYEAGVLMSALTSAVVILFLTRHYFHDQVTAGQMVVCFFEAIVWYGPVALLDLIWLYFIRPLTPEEGVCFSCVVGYVIRYLIFAAFNEELIKLLVIYRMFLSPMTNGLTGRGVPVVGPQSSTDNEENYNDHITWNWKGLIVYGVCVGSGMGAAENIYKVYIGGWFTAVRRSYMPFHVATGG